MVWGMCVLSGLIPLCRAWAAARGSTSRHPLAWAVLAWAAWGLAAWSASAAAAWLALSLTVCSGVSVLNARRPHAFAWHFVVAGLLVVLLRPLWEGVGELRPGGLYVAALGVGLAVAVGNHLPTRLGLPAVGVGVACGVVLARLRGADVPDWPAWGLTGVAPWLAWLLVRRTPGGFDGEWLAFRDRFGFGWAALTRELFNNTARNADWAAELRWGGLRGEAGGRELDALRALTRRFREG